MEDKDYIIFENYLSDNLTDMEVLDFEKRLVTDSDFKADFETYKELENYLKFNLGNTNTEAFKENLEYISNTYFQENHKRESRSKSKYFKIGKLAVAATIIICFGLFIFKNNSQPTYGDFSEHEQISLSVRGESKKLLNKAEKAFNNKSYDVAELYFSEILGAYPKNTEIQLYRAITQIEQNKFDEADATLNTIAKTDSAYKNAALWYAALSKLKQKKYATCIMLLKKLPNDTVYYKKAQKLIDKLN